MSSWAAGGQDCESPARGRITRLAGDAHAAPAAMQDQLHLSRPDGFRYLSRSGCVSVPGIDDVKEFH